MSCRFLSQLRPTFCAPFVAWHSQSPLVALLFRSGYLRA
eukprot:COSAG06_NODE_69649_length_196_cov_257.536082_1_plen_38_part_10